jgi:type II secretory pathway component PulK
MRRRRGIIFVTALGIIVVLTGLALVFAQAMRTEAIASANRRSDAQADAIELGAEQWVMAQVDAYTTDAMTITQVPAEAIQVGSGYFWVLQFNPDNDTEDGRLYGITDECSKLNINETTSAELETLPTDIEQNVADAINDWHNTAARASSDGAETDYYQALSEPYAAKNAPYETVEEMLLVSGVTPALLWGNGQVVVDLNRDGVLQDAERQSAGFSTMFTGAGTGIDGRGVYNYLTCFSRATSRVATQVVNVNTASDVVLACLPGMDAGDAAALVSAREGNDQTSATWVRQTLTTAKYNQILPYITGQSHQYSADIVAVSGDGRSFRRVYIVVDGTTTPAKIVYRKDLTSFGWPLPQTIHQQLLSGQGIQAGSTSTSLTSGVNGAH